MVAVALIASPEALPVRVAVSLIASPEARVMVAAVLVARIAVELAILVLCSTR